MDEQDQLAARFEADRAHLRAVAYRMLGSVTEAEDAVQEAWFRLSRSDTSEVTNLTGWLTTVVSRVCLDALRARRARPEQALTERMPDPVVNRLDPDDQGDPAHEAVLADGVGLALLVVLDSLAPPERLAYVLHDMFGLPFDEIAPMVDRTPAATRQLASRARRRIQGRPVAPVGAISEQRAVVEAFLAASRDGDFDRLVALLDPDVVLRADRGAGALHVVEGSETVASEALLFRRSAGPEVRAETALVNGAVGIVASRDGAPLSVLSFLVVDGRIASIDILAHRERLATLDLAGLA
ncbi:sigma-70 family RNA polymerase sigma factor [Iamia sp. SCSIO 61187]|uniref:sigma-70 family RNA polymerase sigma factor n=1 Tax=Iamia sp. SCSIO 61187 TaxID=2722752 RepID=UPI001C62DACE|nr:sigma-70 family RNA polymerase sigma factor [Iamia sp. SCSIO 61187]QYG91899.1 sigma-70 family RNA polymerase sigma factor [Iamia sp. SCSIO 61187]